MNDNFGHYWPGKGDFKVNGSLWGEGDGMRFAGSGAGGILFHLSCEFFSLWMNQMIFFTPGNNFNQYGYQYGLIGKILDALMIRKQSDTGIKKFFTGLKSYAESQ